MKIFTQRSKREFLQVLSVIFPLTVVIPMIMNPLIEWLSLSPSSPISILLFDIVIVGLAVFILLPILNKLTNK